MAKKDNCPKCNALKHETAKMCRKCRDTIGDTKICTKCKKDLPLSSFRQRERKTGMRPVSQCFTCETAHSMVYNKQWRKDNPKRDLFHKLKKMGLESKLDEIFELKNSQQQCAICKQNAPNGFKLNVDHDHETGKFRGLLCSFCNTALGMFKDNIDSLLEAVEYLKKSKLS